MLVSEFGARGVIWKYAAPGKKSNSGHPATMPEGLAADHIRTWSNAGDLVLDPFAGSGTTLRMAKKLGRNYIGFEIDKDYYELANELLNPVQNEL